MTNGNKAMNKIYLYSIGVLACIAGLAACQPDDLTPSTSAEPITSITATMDINGYEDVQITGYPDENNRILIPVPYYYPETSDNLTPESALEHAKVVATLANNVTVEPHLRFMDLTKENEITVTDQAKKKIKYIVTAAITKNSECEITAFSLPDASLSGVINGNDISLVSAETIPTCTAEVTLSPHATMDPDPRVVPQDWNNDVTIKVTAFDEEHTATYVVSKGVPQRLESGIRSGSETILFEKRLNADLGISVDSLTTGLAVSGNYLVINTRGEDLMLLDRMTGDKVGTVVLPDDLKGNVRNFYITSDDAGHIFMCNLINNDGNVFKIWKINDVNSTPELYISWETDGSLAFGRKFSIQGSTDGDAVITAPCNTNPTNGFYQWTVSGGVLQNPTVERGNQPTWVTVTDGGTWSTNVDLVRMTPDPVSDYFYIAYSSNQLTWVDGSANKVKKQLGAVSVNYVPNAVDVVEFNNSHFLAATQLNSFTWGGADNVWLLDVTIDANFAGTLPQEGGSGDVPAVKWYTYNTYGAKALGNPTNDNYLADVILSTSDNGYYMYLYFMFCNGYVVGMQFDCIDM